MPTGPEWNVLPLARDITIAVNASIQLTGCQMLAVRILKAWEDIGKHRICLQEAGQSDTMGKRLGASRSTSRQTPFLKYFLPPSVC